MSDYLCSAFGQELPILGQHNNFCDIPKFTLLLCAVLFVVAVPAAVMAALGLGHHKVWRSEPQHLIAAELSTPALASIVLKWIEVCEQCPAPSVTCGHFTIVTYFITPF